MNVVFCFLLMGRSPLGLCGLRGFHFGCSESWHLIGQDPWDSLIFMELPELSFDSTGLVLRDSLVFTGLVCSLHQALLQNHACSICADNTVFFGITDWRKPESEFVLLPQTLWEWQSAFVVHTAVTSVPPVRHPTFLLTPKQDCLLRSDDNSSGLRASMPLWPYYIVINLISHFN